MLKGRIVREQDHIREGKGKHSVRVRERENMWTDGCDRAAFTQKHTHIVCVRVFVYACEISFVCF